MNEGKATYSQYQCTSYTGPAKKMNLLLNWCQLCISFHNNRLAMVVHLLLILKFSSQIFNICLQNNLQTDQQNFKTFKKSTSTKGTVRLNRSQTSIIFTQEVIGRDFETLMNLKKETVFMCQIENIVSLHLAIKYNNKYSYMVVSTSITVRLTVIIACTIMSKVV